MRLWSGARRISWIWPFAGIILMGALVGVGAAGCGSGGEATESGQLKVVAITTYLADIAQNVAGDRVRVASLIPEGGDSHSFEPTPRDVKLLADGRMVILDIAGLSPLIDDLIEGSAHEGQRVVEAATGLAGRPAAEGGGIDPHFWLDPVSVITYVENVRVALSEVDPEGADSYNANAEGYLAELKELDTWIVGEVERIPAARRLLVTNHEEFGYFAARYGFKIVGAVFPSVSSEGAPSAQQLAALVAEIRATGAPAIFLEAGTNADLANEVARETRVEVVRDLYTHSLAQNARSYIDMMRWDVARIVEALL